MRPTSAQSVDTPRTRIQTCLSAEEDTRVGALLTEADTTLGSGEAIVARASAVIEAIRAQQKEGAGISALLHEYSLSSREGVVLMCLAEALLRVPDSLTADRLIRDKIGGGDWQSHVGASRSLFVNASAWGLLLTGKVVQLRGEGSESAGTILRRTVARAGEPAIRAAMRLAMRIMGTQFVLGTDIDSALEKSQPWVERGYRYSYDMLGEGARDASSAREYFEDYCRALTAVGRSAGSAGPEAGPGCSVKLSALHPRVEDLHVERLHRELAPRLLELARIARNAGIGLTIDAEEANRLELTLGLFEAVYLDPSLRDWDGLGLAVQAYQKAAPAVIDWLEQLAGRGGRRIMVRLVKGAYWDAEIKHAQSLGLSAYPVYTRKASTDLSWLVCASRLLRARLRLYPQFATHNAHSACAVLALAGSSGGYEFQRLHGMGEALYEELLERQDAEAACRIYAPVGVHQDLLAYLVRRLLENGANSSFVHNIADESVPAARLAADPRDTLRRCRRFANGAIPLPAALFGAARDNAAGFDLQYAATRELLLAGLARWQASAQHLGCSATAPGAIAVRNPADVGELLGHYAACTPEGIVAAAATAQEAAGAWAATPVTERAACLRRAADALESALPELCGFCVKEAGKTWRDAVADVREAVDFCRYYATEAEALLAGDASGRLCARGPILCISPWNFPVAIFTGQIAAALATGNPAIAKPAEQTTLVALRIVELLHAAGVPAGALQLLAGPGAPVGERLLGDKRIAGVMFTGSTEVAGLIARSLAAREGERAMLIAETGGQNAMIVDSTALPEQVVDDVIASGFNSAGQRCSALRLLLVQEDIADRLIGMLRGAMDELRVGDPADLLTDIGPIIDEEACARLEAHAASLAGRGRLLHACTPVAGSERGHFFAPRLYEIDSLDALSTEVFGPVVHLLRFRAEELEQLPARINALGYGLTFGVHSRIQSTVDRLAREVAVGNVYVNRNIIGAVVGVQPFGGHGLSGTGPKAGGPLYLPRLLREAVTGEPGPVAEAPEPVSAPLLAAGDPSLLEGLRDAQAEWAELPMRARFEAGRALLAGLATQTPRPKELLASLQGVLEQAGRFAQARELPGPTGERNTLEFLPRGVLALLCRGDLGEASLLAPSVAALLAGNALLFLGDAAARPGLMWLREQLSEAGFPDALSAQQEHPDATQLAAAVAVLDIDGVLCPADPALAVVASRALAARSGPILPLLDEPPGPLLFSRLLLEKTVSVNTTASGGNAALMSQAEAD
jgi:RHH-type proline utilization regulon transcriptional repressor/proline dehydrogenase/delta 1-pyrroline-5-carboxylate dehydrogenase